MKRRSPTYTGHNLRKLSVLISCFNYFRTAGQVANDTLIQGESPADHKEAVKKNLSKLRHYFKHPYLDSKHLKTKKEGSYTYYRANKKGRKVACELFYRKKNNIALNWNGRYHIQCVKDCSECQFNPTLNPDYKKIIEQQDTRPIVVMECSSCDYKRTFRVSPGTPQELITMKKEMFLRNHRMKQHGLGGYPIAVNDCRNRRKSKRHERISKQNDTILVDHHKVFEP